ncbi:MAG TPA: SRPBCC domain-containing protein [Verrucomicrobiae bacterium]
MSNETDIHTWLKSTQREVRSIGHRKAALVHRRMDAPRERVWVACTDRDQLRRWFADVTGDLREAATLTFDVGAPCKVTSRILRCAFPHNLLLTWLYPGREIDEVELRLTADGDGTVVELEHRSEDKTEWWLGAGSGWEYALIKLSVLLRGDDPAEVSAEELDQKLGRLWTEAGRT